MPANRLALEVSLATGLRIGDVLRLKTDTLKTKGQRFTIKEQKTGKSRRIYMPLQIYEGCMAQAGKVWIFEGRIDVRKHRTRAAVYKDIRRVAKLYRLDGKKVSEHVSPHTARKICAVEEYRRSGNMRHVQSLLNHSSEAVTALYALADVLTAKRTKTRNRGISDGK